MTAVFSAVVVESLTATGASFTLVTVIVTVATFEAAAAVARRVGEAVGRR